MSISSIQSSYLSPTFDSAPKAPAQNVEGEPELREAFQDFVGQVFFGEMLKAMRKTTGDAPYFNGGQAEKMFTAQLDQVLSEELTKASAASFSDPMFELFSLSRK